MLTAATANPMLLLGDEAVAARLAEAVARASMLEMQMETERVAAAGAAAARGEELQCLKVGVDTK